MVFVRKENPLSLTRNRNEDISLTVYDADGNLFEWGDGDVVVLAMKRNPETGSVVFLKTVTPDLSEAGVVQVEILPSETKDLQLGTHYYDVSIVNGTDITPVIRCSLCDITADIYEPGT